MLICGPKVYNKQDFPSKLLNQYGFYTSEIHTKEPNLRVSLCYVVSTLQLPRYNIATPHTKSPTNL